MVLNIQSLLDHTPDTLIPFEPVYTLMPRSATLAIGNEHTITAKVVNSADNDAAASRRRSTSAPPTTRHSPDKRGGLMRSIMYVMVQDLVSPISDSLRMIAHAI